MLIKLKKVKKIYKMGVESIHALDGVDLEFSEGTLGLLGPNGAGKSTLMKVLATLLPPTSGTVMADGIDILHDRASLRNRLGYLPQAFGAPKSVRVEEFINHIARLKGLSSAKRKTRVREVLETVGLWDVRRRKAKKLSGGMLRRLGIAQALVADP